MQKIVPSLWFEDKCEEAVNFYVETFNSNPNKKAESKVNSIVRYTKDMQVPGIENLVGKVINADFELAGTKFLALDGGPIFKFSGAVSFMIECETQEEVDHFWSKMSADPQAEQCGWIKDKYGMSWQIVPKRLGELLSDTDKDKSMRVMNAMLGMKKIDIASLEKAYSGN